MEAVLGGPALDLDLVDALLERAGAVIDTADGALQLPLALADALLDVEAGFLANAVEFAAQLGVDRLALLGEHLFDALADALELLVELGAGALRRRGDARLGLRRLPRSLGEVHRASYGQGWLEIELRFWSQYAQKLSSAPEASAAQHVEAEAAHGQLVAVAQRPPFDRLAVDGDAVEAAVVEDPKRLAGLGDDQRVAAGDAGVVDAQVGGGAAADPGPAAFDQEHVDLVVIALHRQAVAGARVRLACLLKPAGRPRPLGEGDFAGRRAVVLVGREDRVAAELGGAAAGAIGKLVGLLHREVGAAAEAKESALAGSRAGHVGTVERGAADGVEDRCPPFVRLGTILARASPRVTQFR